MLAHVPVLHVSRMGAGGGDSRGSREVLVSRCAKRPLFTAMLKSPVPAFGSRCCLYVADLDEQLSVYLSQIPRQITHAQYIPTTRISVGLVVWVVRLGQEQLRYQQQQHNYSTRSHSPPPPPTVNPPSTTLQPPPPAPSLLPSQAQPMRERRPTL